MDRLLWHVDETLIMIDISPIHDGLERQEQAYEYMVATLHLQQGNEALGVLVKMERRWYVMVRPTPRR